MDAAGAPIRLGPGSMGTTYRALDTLLRRRVALKVIDERLLANPVSRRRFFNEARSAAQLEHPSIARVLYLSPEDARVCFFAMELVEGETLGARIDRLGPLRPKTALRLLRQVVEALTCLGRNRIVHRDIKPDNVMLGTDPRGGDRVKLIDFGLAKTITPGVGPFDPANTEQAFVGSVSYASPEQVRAAEDLDQRSDFYSLGATLWHALTGAPPFSGNLFQVQQSQVTREPPWEKAAAFAPALVQLLHRLLAKSPAARPADAAELSRLWDEALIAVAREPAAPPPRVPVPVHVASQFGSQLEWNRAEAVPFGCSAPPSSGFLARDPAGSQWYFIRVIPPGIPALLRAEIFTVATRARDHRHPSLRRVVEVTDECIVSAWDCGVTLEQLLAGRRTDLPPAQVLAWLPALAEAIDFARTTDLAGLSLAFSHLWLEFIAAPADRARLDLTAEPPERWSRPPLLLDPLGAFDPMLESFTALGIVADELLTTPRVVALPLPHLAAALYRLLGGTEPAPGRPLAPRPMLSAERNRLLIDTLEAGVQLDHAAAWARAFLDDQLVPRIGAAPALTTGRRQLAWKPIAAALLLYGLGFAAFRSIFAPHAVERPPALPAATPAPIPSPAPAIAIVVPPPAPVATPAPPPASTPAPALPPADFVNSLGMRFKQCTIVAAAGERVLLAAIWETRHADYHAFIRETGHAAPTAFAGLDGADDLPVVGVSWQDATDFCAWLTARENTSATIAPGQRYRLPTDHEWSSFAEIAGIRDETFRLPLAQSHQKILDRYPWGTAWPPPPAAGNLADATLRATWPQFPVIASYQDGFAGPAPVGRFPPNPQGLHDLSGNVFEWCEDAAGEDGFHLSRGSSFLTADRDALLCSHRLRAPTATRRSDIGFRVVLTTATAR